jgi:beta-lactamase class A
MTIATYATQMISISDNTAADALIHIDGPRALAPYAGANLPFMTTREMVTLKSTEGAALRARYLAATTPAARASILRQSDALPLPAIETLVTDPLIAIEWHYSVRDLCTMMRRVAKLPLMSVNPGGADASAFRHVAFKGGSDFGIMNLTTMVTTRRGTTFCVSATVNDATKPVDETTFGQGYAAVLRSLEDR